MDEQTSIKVSVSVTGTSGDTVNCTFTPKGPYDITYGTNNVRYQLDEVSEKAGWLFTGVIQEDDQQAQLSVLTKAHESRLKVKDVNSKSGLVSYKLQLILNNKTYWTTDPQNNNSGNGCPP